MIHTRPPSRRGIALGIVLALLLVLGSFGVVFRMLSRNAFLEVDALSDHLRALAVAEAACAEVVARLSSTPWEQRWFRAGPDIVHADTPGGGSYDALVRDAATGAPADADAPAHEVDVLVKARHERASVVAFWRLAVPRNSLESVVRVIPTFFTLPPDGSAVTPAGSDAIGRDVDDLIRQRAASRPRFDELRPRLDGATTPGEVGTVVGFDPGGEPLSGVPGPDGAPPPPVDPLPSEPPPPAADLETPEPGAPPQWFANHLRYLFAVENEGLASAIWRVCRAQPRVVDAHALVEIERVSNAALAYMMQRGPTDPGLTIKGVQYAQASRVRAAAAGATRDAPVPMRAACFQLVAVRLTPGGQIGPLVKVGERVRITGPVDENGWVPAVFAGVAGWVPAPYFEP